MNDDDALYDAIRKLDKTANRIADERNRFLRERNALIEAANEVCAYLWDDCDDEPREAIEALRRALEVVEP